MMPRGPAWPGGAPQAPLPLHLPFLSPQGTPPQKMNPQMAQAWTGALHCSHDTLLVGAGSAGSRQQATRLFSSEAAIPYGIFNV